MNYEKIVGIDLGTTNSVIAVLDATDSRMIFGQFGEDQKREPLLPSAVALDPATGKTLVGRPARARRGLSPPPVLSHKRGMGKEVKFQFGSQQVEPAEMGAKVLAALADRLREQLAASKEPFGFSSAVITVPAHFKHPAMEATTLAGEKAGLRVVELLHEPTAAVIHYCWTRRCQERRQKQPEQSTGEETFLVFDMGGGTFDVSVIRRIPNPATGDDFQTLAIAGDSFLGGDDFDRDIARDLFVRVAEGYTFHTLNPGEPQNEERYAKLLALAEQIKIRTSDAEEATVDRQNVFTDDAGRPVHAKLTYTRSQVEALLSETAQRTLAFCESAIVEAKLSKNQIDTVLMIGGSSRTPLVQRLVTKAFCEGALKARCARPIVHAPDLCVGAGAALKAASLGAVFSRQNGRGGARMLGYGSSSQTRTMRRFELCDKEATLAGGSATLSAQNGPTVQGRILGTQRVLFDGIELAPEQNRLFRCQLKGPSLALDFEFQLRHDPLFAEPLGLSTSANVLSYELSLEVENARTRELERFPIAPKLTPLPQEFKYQFRFPGNTRKLLFPLFGDTQEIKTIAVEVDPTTPAGAQIDLFVSIDASQKVQARGEIALPSGKKPFAFEVDSPKPAKMPTLEEFRELDALVASALAQYRGKNLGQLAMRHSKLGREIERAFDHRDSAKVIQRMEDLRQLLAELDPSKQRVDPPLETLQQMHRECHALIGILRGKTTLPLDEIQDDVDLNMTVATQAAGELPPDQEKYTQCFNNIERHHKALLDEYHKHQAEESDGDKAARFLNAGRKLLV
jgi:molecular chaperone DnaK